ncbi:hypothetical protein BGX38DRAFT_1290868 [Terfezia claveryi]|nr:hypothetical protein BGX38DRAFT_1290868 [Terfezia claveryi]
MSASVDLAPPPRGVVYGPIEDWGKGSCKLLLNYKIGGEESLMRQYVVEDVERWILVPEFGKEGEKALNQARVHTELVKKEWEGVGEGDWCKHVSQVERNLREEEEVIRVTDGPSAERAMAILNRAIAIQDGAANGQLNGYEVEYSSADKGDEMLESITVRPAQSTGQGLFNRAHHWTLTTPKSKKKATGHNTVKEQLGRLEAKLEEVKEEGEESESEVLRKKGKKRRIGEGNSLEGLGRKLGIDLREPAVPRSFEDIRSNVFGEAPPAWKIQDSQKEWLEEGPQASMDWAEEAEDTIETPGAEEGTLADSIHAIKELTEEEIKTGRRRRVQQDKGVSGRQFLK